MKTLSIHLFVRFVPLRISILALFLAALSVSLSVAQDQKKSRSSYNLKKVSLELQDGQRSKVVELSRASHDSLVAVEKNKMVVYKVSSIKSIRIHKKGSGGLGTFVGLVVGLGLGIGIAATVDSNSDNAGTWLAFGVLGAAIGGAAGGAIASKGKTYQINGQQEQFDLFLKKLYKQ